MSTDIKYCDVFHWRPSLLGNRSHNSSMDTPTTPVLLRYMVTNTRRASVSIVAGSVKERKTIHRVSPRPSVSEVSPRPSTFEVSRRQLVSGSRRDQSSKRSFAMRSQRLARVAVVSRVRSFSMYLVVNCCQLSVIVICLVIISIANKSGNQSEPFVVRDNTFLRSRVRSVRNVEA
jgi:hypothetical protein